MQSRIQYVASISAAFLQHVSGIQKDANAAESDDLGTNLGYGTGKVDTVN